MHCYKYWPEFVNGNAKYGTVNVTLSEEIDEGSYNDRTFTITKEGYKPRTVHHFHQYTA